MTEPQQTMHLIGYGRVPAKRANELAVGDTMIWNYGYRYVVLEIWQKSPAFVGVRSRCYKTGKEHEQRFRNLRLIGVDPDAECRHYGDWDHHYDHGSTLGDYYTCSQCGELTQVG